MIATDMFFCFYRCRLVLTRSFFFRLHFYVARGSMFCHNEEGSTLYGNIELSSEHALK